MSYLSFGRVLFRRKAPRRAEIRDPRRIPNLALFKRWAPSAPRAENDRSAMNIETVKPMPHRTQTLAKAFHDVPSGRETNFSFTLSHEN